MVNKVNLQELDEIKISKKKGWKIGKYKTESQAAIKPIGSPD